jgi:hypothetical protein
MSKGLPAARKHNADPRASMPNGPALRTDDIPLILRLPHRTIPLPQGAFSPLEIVWRLLDELH